MKYVIDTEFIEGFHKPLFGKKRHFIDLISIAIVAEDGREYYAISSEYSYKDASQWVRDNVIVPAYTHMVHGDQRLSHEPENFHKYYGKPNAQIAKEIYKFVNPHIVEEPNTMAELFMRNHNIVRLDQQTGVFFAEYVAHPEFWAYYADYDWVLFCSLFGTMMDLPKGFPMYCRDLQQKVDEMIKLPVPTTNNGFVLRKDGQTFSLDQKEKQHIALYDARWGMDLLRFITG
jgi:hypothetical protein